VPIELVLIKINLSSLNIQSSVIIIVPKLVSRNKLLVVKLHLVDVALGVLNRLQHLSDLPLAFVPVLYMVMCNLHVIGTALFVLFPHDSVGFHFLALDRTNADVHQGAADLNDPSLVRLDDQGILNLNESPELGKIILEPE